MQDPRATHSSVPFDLYRDVHKAIRVTMFDVVAEAGRLDVSDRAARVGHATKVRDLVLFLQFHAEHEDAVLDAPIRAVLPEQADDIAAAHVALEARMLVLVELADLACDTTRADDRAAVHDLYLELASFVADYLEHQDVEERVVMPALWDAFGFDRLHELHGQILARITPDQMGWSLAMMLPAMNVDDRTEMLGGMRAEAPPEAFAGVWALAQQVLSSVDVAQLGGRLDLQPVGA